MPQNSFFLRTRDLLVSQKTMRRHFIFTLHPLSTVIFATATVLAFVLLRNSSFNFHCYTQREATPTQKSARKCAATFRDFFAEKLQRAFTLANQLRWIAQYCSLVTFCGLVLILHMYRATPPKSWCFSIAWTVAEVTITITKCFIHPSRKWKPSFDLTC